MARRSNRRPIARGPKRNLFWARTSVTHSPSSPDDLSFRFDLLSDFNTVYGASLFGFTVTRTIIHLDNWTGDATTQTRLPWGAGIRVADRVIEDSVVDTESEQQMQDPISDPYADWMFYHRWDAMSGDGTSRGIGYRQDFDIKSQRKLSELGQSLYLIGGVGLDVDGVDYGFTTFNVQLLLKQP